LLHRGRHALAFSSAALVINRGFVFCLVISIGITSHAALMCCYIRYARNSFLADHYACREQGSKRSVIALSTVTGQDHNGGTAMNARWKEERTNERKRERKDGRPVYRETDGGAMSPCQISPGQHYLFQSDTLMGCHSDEKLYHMLTSCDFTRGA